MKYKLVDDLNNFRSGIEAPDGSIIAWCNARENA